MRTAGPEREPPLSRRAFGGAVLLAVGLAGCIGRSGGQPESYPVERDGWQVSEVQVERQHSFVGASAVLYNSPANGERTVRVRYRLYDTEGTLLYETTERARVDPGQQRRVARWWRLEQPASTPPEIGFADVEIVGGRS